jgi:hypothetical protein
MARAALAWTVRELASNAKVHRNTITRLEAGAQAEPRTLKAVVDSMEAAGIEFIDGSAPGVRIRSGAQPAAASGKLNLEPHRAESG